MKVSKTQIDKLGEKLKKGPLSGEDVKALDEYRRSFNDPYETVVRTIHERTQLEPTGRPAKSTSSIKEKLLRESIRLIQIQDIAGCRIVVADIAEQENVIQALKNSFPPDSISVIDRRENPSHGYRAVHVIVQVSGKLIEIQIRSTLQHRWAEFSEKLSDVIDPKLKYGAGEKEFQEVLSEYSELVANYEKSEIRISRLGAQNMRPEYMIELKKIQQEMSEQKTNIANLLNVLLASVKNFEEK